MNKMYVYVSYFNYSTDKITKLLITWLFFRQFKGFLRVWTSKWVCVINVVREKKQLNNNIMEQNIQWCALQTPLLSLFKPKFS